MSTQFHSGINCKAYAGTATAAVELPTISFSLSPTAEKVGFRNSKTGRFTQYETTFVNLTGTINLDWDFLANPFLPANGGVSLTSGGTNAFKLYISGTSGAFWDIPSAVIDGNPFNNAVEGKPALSVNFTANGTYVEPAT